MEDNVKEHGKFNINQLYASLGLSSPSTLLPTLLPTLPSTLLPNLSLVLRLPVSYLIFPKSIIVLDKVVISSIPPNSPYYITIILIVSSDKDISPNTIVSSDKDSALILIIVLDRATLQPLL